MRYAQERVERATPEQKAEALKELARAYWQDQEQGKAIEIFFQALEALPPSVRPWAASEAETLYYQEALQIYLDPQSKDPRLNALRLRDGYAGIVRLYPDYVGLGYLVAASYANLGDFDQFFQRFFDAYKRHPNHYLAWKAQAILHIKLLERSTLVEVKEAERVKIIKDLEKAKELFSEDSSLYRMQIAFAADREKRQILQANVREIMEKSIIPPRAELSFYFDQLMLYGERELAVEFLKKARRWYPYSRTLDAAEAILGEK